MTRLGGFRRSSVQEVLPVLLLAAGLAAVIWLARGQLQGPTARLFFELADGSSGRIVVLIMVVGAAVVPAGLLARAALRRWGPRAVPAAVPVALLAVPCAAFLPGRRDRGRTANALDAATRSKGDFFGSSDAFVGGAVGAGFAILGSIMVALVLIMANEREAVGSRLDEGDGGGGGGAREGHTGRRLAVIAGVYLAAWALATVVVVRIVGDTPTRDEYLQDYVAQLRAGTDGLLGDFDPGVATDVVREVSCTDADALLDVDGSAPVLDECRTAILIHGTGVSATPRHAGGEVTAVLLSVSSEGAAGSLAAALDGATLRGGHGLPAPTGTTVAVPVHVATAVLVTTETVGAGQQRTTPTADDPGPLTRALRYALSDAFIDLPPPAGAHE